MLLDNTVLMNFGCIDGLRSLNRVGFTNLKIFGRININKFWNKNEVRIWQCDIGHLCCTPEVAGPESHFQTLIAFLFQNFWNRVRFSISFWTGILVRKNAESFRRRFRESRSGHFCTEMIGITFLTTAATVSKKWLLLRAHWRLAFRLFFTLQ